MFQNNNNNFPKIWVRYVDDVFAIVDETFNIDLFLQQISSQYSSIKFTYEKEVGGKLPFLDLLVKRVENQLKFEIYRKKTHTFRYIPKNSNHHWQQKMYCSICIKRTVYGCNLMFNNNITYK